MKDFHFNTADALEKAKADRDKPVTPVEYKPVISNVGADANMLWPDTMYGLLPKGTGKITLHESKPMIVAHAIEKDQAAQPAPVQELDAAFFRQVLSVAIAGLYAHYKDDVLRVFTLDDLQKVVDLAEPLQLQQVEDIYKRAWEMLTTPPAAQRQFGDDK